MSSSGLTRKEFLVSLVLSGAAGSAPRLMSARRGQDDEITLEDLKTFEKVAGISFTEEERQQVLRNVQGMRRGYQAVRERELPNSVPPATVFRPVGKQPEESKAVVVRHRDMPNLARPSDEDLPFLTVAELSQLVKQRKVSPVELTELALKRLETYGGPLLNVVVVTRELALRQARQAQQEIAAGRYRGPLHGIPYAIKDLFAVQGYPTQWGSGPHRGQQFAENCAVFEKLTEAGAVCCAKTSLGSLAMGDVWYAGRTKNPWNQEQGSSGSSAGSASAMAAGLVPFTIGTETQGSIVSPSHRCRVTGLRPTFGRVSRFGAMTLSWTMDKAGPICRTAEDCMLVLAALNGADPRDPASVDRPLSWDPEADVSSLKVGVLQQGEEPVDTASQNYLAALENLGVDLQPVKFSALPAGVTIDLSVESAAAFDHFTTTDQIDGLENSSWPQIFRAHRYVPAVEYLQALRVRHQLMLDFESELGDFDAVIAPGTGGQLLLTTNRTGHPQLLVPNGVDDRGREQSFSIFGRLYDEATVCALGWRIQQETRFFRARPSL